MEFKDVGKMCLENDEWAFDKDKHKVTKLHGDTPISYDKTDLGHLTSKNQFSNKLTIFSLDNDKKAVLVEIDPKRPKKDGCRAAGLVLSALIEHYGTGNKLPEQVFVKSKIGFELRGLLTFQYIGDPKLRKNFMKSFQEDIAWTKNLEITKNKNATQYQKDAMSKISDKTGNKIIEKNLKMPGLPRGIRTDGMCITDKKVVILETKKLERNFTEGISQLIQNYAVVHTHLLVKKKIKPENRKRYTSELVNITEDNPEIESWLLTAREPAKEAKKELYEKIIKFLNGSKKISFYVYY